MDCTKVMNSTQVKDNPDVVAIEKVVGGPKDSPIDFYSALVAVIQQASISQFGIGLNAGSEKPVEEGRYGVSGNELRDYFAHPTPESPAHLDKNVKEVVRFIDSLPAQVREPLRGNISHLLADVTVASYGTGLGDALRLYGKEPSFRPALIGADFIEYFEAKASTIGTAR